MADKQISDLTSASAMTDGSLFVIEQGGAAKSANWGMMKQYISPNVAPQYSSSSTYAVGDYVIYNNQLYRCTTAITTAESWTAAHWVSVALGNEVTDLKSALTNGNFNQHIKVNPLVVGTYSEIGKMAKVRSALSVLQGGGIKAERDSNSSSKNYGGYFRIETDSSINLTGHKIYVRIAGVDVTGAEHYSYMSIFGSYNTTVVENTRKTFTGENYETILEPDSNINYLYLMLSPGDTVSNGEYFTFSSAQWIDLTAMFGAGKEPEIETFKKIYTQFPYEFKLPNIYTNTAEAYVYAVNESGKIGEKSYLNYISIPSPITSVDDITENSVYQIESGSTIEGLPYDTGLACTVITNKFTSGGTYRTQLIIEYTSGRVWYRYCSNNTWSSWVDLTEFGVGYKNQGRILSGNDLDDYTTDGVWTVALNASPDNWPLENGAGTLIASKMFNLDTYIQQICIPYYVDSTTLSYRFVCGFYSRYKNGSNAWSNWAFVKMTPRNHGKKYYAFGDSTTWGYSSDHSHAQSPWNYPAMVGDLIGVEVHNNADPAQGLIKDWASPATPGNFPIVDTIAEMVENGDFENTALITVGWAYNDSNYYSSLNFGNPTDPIPESTSGITTWIGYYAKILDILQKAAPYAQVILVTGFGYTTNTEGHKTDEQFSKVRTFADGEKTIKQMYDALEEMANYYGYCCVNQAKGCAITRANGSIIIGDNIHPTYDNYRVYGNNVASRIAALFQNV